MEQYFSKKTDLTVNRSIELFLREFSVRNFEYFSKILDLFLNPFQQEILSLKTLQTFVTYFPSNIEVSFKVPILLQLLW